MNLMLVTDHYPPSVGGAERQTQLLAQRFAAAGNDVVVVAPARRGLPRTRDEDGVIVHRLPQMLSLFARVDASTHRHAPPYPDPVLSWRLRRLIRGFKPDVVHSQGWMTYSAAAALLGRTTPLLVSVRDYGYFCPNRQLLHRGGPCSGPGPAKCLSCAGAYYGRPKGWVATIGVFAGAPLLRRKLRAVHSISNYVAAAMHEHFFDGHGTSRPLEALIPSFRDDERDRQHPSNDDELAGLPNEPFIVYAGQLRTAKGVEILFRAYETLASPPPLVLIGSPQWDGPDAFPPYANVMGRLSHAAVLAAFDRAAFAVMPSLWPEPLGSVVHEAMSRGKPVIGTNHGGHPDMIVDGENGLLVPPGDVDALAAAMQALVDDAELRAKLGAAARARSKLFDASTAIPRFGELYTRLQQISGTRDGRASGARSTARP
jgi:glycosyltransferase involved in cell wall biosynthesis